MTPSEHLTKLIGEKVPRLQDWEAEGLVKHLIPKWKSVAIDGTPTTVQEDHIDHIHFWCGVRWKPDSPMSIEHLAWNPYHLVWDSEDEDDVSRFNSRVEIWQPIVIPELSKDGES